MKHLLLTPLKWIWRSIIAVWEVISASALVVVMNVICFGLIFYTSQGSEIALAIQEHSFIQKLGLLGAAFLWCLMSWYWCRVALNEHFGRRSSWAAVATGARLPALPPSIASLGLELGEKLPLNEELWLRRVQASSINWLPRICGVFPVMAALVFSITQTSMVGWTMAAAGVYLLLLIATNYRATLRNTFRVAWLRPYWGDISFVMAMVIIGLFLFQTLRLGQFFGPIGTVFLFFTAVLPLFAALSSWTAKWRFPTVLALLLVIALGHIFEPNRHHIRAYDESALPENRLVLDAFFGHNAVEEPAATKSPSSASIQALSRDEGCGPVRMTTALEAWLRAQLCTPAVRQIIDANAGPIPIVVVTTAGGGIRAALWTALILGAVQDQHPTFTQRVFAISGVSGGALGATVFAASQHPSSRAQTTCDTGTEAPLRPCGTLAAAYGALSQDFLGPVVAAYAFNDTFGPLLALAGLNVPSRATILEKAWEAACQQAGCYGLSGAFHAALIRDARWAPALFLNGTHVETGKRIITSPLVITPRNFDDALDFFTLHGREIRVSTAALNSARFPFMTPVGRLGRDDTHYGHLGDGGYFENYGAETGAEIMRVVRRFAHQYGRYIKPVVVEISSDPELAPIDLARNSRGQRAGSDKDCTGEQVQLALDEPLRTKCRSTQFSGFTQLTGPAAAIMGSREARGIQTARRVWGQVEQGDGIALQFALCSFSDEEPNRPPLGWTLSRETRERMRKQVAEMMSADPKLEQCKGRDCRPLDECNRRNAEAMHRLRKILDPS
jgi:hypothetical protein